MKSEGLYITLLPGGKIKRHLSTRKGEVPLEDTTIGDELIRLSECNHVHLYGAIKEIWLYADTVTQDGAAFAAAVDGILDTLRRENVQRHTLLLTLLDDRPNQFRPFSFTDEAYFIAETLSRAMLPDGRVYRVLDALSRGRKIDLLDEYFMLRQSEAVVRFTYGESLTAQYQFRSEEQYYIFLLQQFLLSEPRGTVCQYCGQFFIPKTAKKTLYCDRIIRDGKTCKQIGARLKHRERVAANRVVSEFTHTRDVLTHRLNRTGEDKKKSPVDLTDPEFCLRLAAATDARNRFLAGELSEDEAMEIIHVPRIWEL